MATTVKRERHRLNKDSVWLKPASKFFPFGGISIALIEGGFSNIQDAGGACYYQNSDGTMTMEMTLLKDEKDKTKPLSHTFSKKEWGFVRQKKRVA